MPWRLKAILLAYIVPRTTHPTEHPRLSGEDGIKREDFLTSPVPQTSQWYQHLQNIQGYRGRQREREKVKHSGTSIYRILRDTEVDRERDSTYSAWIAHICC